MRTLRHSWCAWTWALVVLAIISCGASQRETTLKAAFVTVNTVRNGFATYDKIEQQKIVDAAKTADEGTAGLLAYRARREKILVIFDDVYRALTSAVVTEDAKSLAHATQLATALKQAYDDLQKASHQ